MSYRSPLSDDTMRQSMKDVLFNLGLTKEKSIKRILDNMIRVLDEIGGKTDDDKE